jgi:hypothetical protein
MLNSQLVLVLSWCCMLRPAGVIVNADLPAEKRPRLQGAAFNGPPTRILVLRNMVGPGEVDEDLEEEVGSGCKILFVQGSGSKVVSIVTVGGGGKHQGCGFLGR